MSGAILAIGGGGFLMGDTSALQERYLLRHVRSTGQAPRVLYLGTASGDGERAQLAFLQTFLKLGAAPATLPFFPFQMQRDYAAEVLAADLVYVGGGNTVAMLAVWREFGFDQALQAGWQGGTVLAGISAGGNCWFEHFITDSVQGGGVRPGLGWLPGTFCPHLDSEPWRRALVDTAPGLPVYAAPEHTVLHFAQGRFVEAVTAREGQSAVVRLQSGDQAGPLATRLLAA